jgi:polyisoprenoid-binding protein YceI
MRNVLLFSFLGIVLLASPAHAVSGAAQAYTVDKVHSTVGFSVTHLMVSKVIGSFGDFEDDTAFSADDLTASKFNFKVKPASVNTLNEQRDQHLRGPDFFDAEKYPLITFVSKKVTAKGDGDFEVTGDLTMKDVTKEVTIPVKILGPVPNPFGAGTILGIEAHFSLNRQDYHVKWNKALDSGGFMVSDMVDVNVSLEAHSK